MNKNKKYFPPDALGWRLFHLQHAELWLPLQLVSAKT